MTSTARLCRLLPKGRKNIKAQIIKRYQHLSDREAFVTAEMVRNAYQGLGSEYETLLGAFEKNLATLNMKNSLMNLFDKLMLRKRSVIETVNDELKNVCQIEHTRHRSIDNFATNLFAGLIAYNLLPKKPEMNIEIIDRSRLSA